MKINILYKFRDDPWGGGNQFLKALRSYFLSEGIYEEDTKKADIVLFNSHHQLDVVAKLALNYPDKIMVHRVDGPISYIRGNHIELDKIIFKSNQLIADSTIFQSEWSKQKSFELRMKRTKYISVIMNAPDPAIFYRSEKTHNHTKRKIKLIATSWSANKKKGFDVYEYLDRNLDFNKYAMTFIGNSPIHFKNIRHIQPLPSFELADKLREHDIFITASLDDPCSNSLLEALHCGLPAVARKSGGHPEIIGKSGITFNGTDDVCEAIEKLSSEPLEYKDKLSLPSIEQTGEQYYHFMEKIYIDVMNGSCKLRKLTTVSFIELKLWSILWNFISTTKDKISRIKRYSSVQ